MAKKLMPLFFSMDGTKELYEKYGIDPYKMTPMEGLNVMIHAIDKRLEALNVFENRLFELEAKHWPMRGEE